MSSVMAAMCSNTRQIRDVKDQTHTVISTDGVSITADSVVIATHLPMLDHSGHFAILKPSRSHCIAVRFSSASTMTDGISISCSTPLRSLRVEGNDDDVFLLEASLSVGR